MGTILDPKANFLGLPLTTYRDALRRWLRFRDVREVVSTQKLSLSPQAAAVLINEADLSGFFNGDELTDSGRGFVGSSPLRPMKRDKAKEIIDMIVSNCGMINRRDDLCFQIERVWLFGSYITGAATVNDIDIVVEESRIPGRSLMNPIWRDRTIELACEMEGDRAVYGSVGYASNADQYLLKRLTYGPHKHPRVSPNDRHTLIDMACECQLVFDRSRGGPVQDSVLAKHPEATQRSENIHARAVMPNLRAAPATVPIRIDLASIGDDGGNFASLANVDLYRVETDADGVSDDLFNDWLASLGKLDGRERSIVAYLPDGRGQGRSREPRFGAAVERAIALDGNTFSYSLTVSDLYLGGRRSISPDAAESMAGKVLLAIGCDIEAIARKHMDSGLCISIETRSMDDMTEQFRQLIQNELERKTAWLADSKPGWLSREVRERIAAGDMYAEVVCPEPLPSSFRPR